MSGLQVGPWGLALALALEGAAPSPPAPPIDAGTPRAAPPALDAGVAPPPAPALSSEDTEVVADLELLERLPELEALELLREVSRKE